MPVISRRLANLSLLMVTLVWGATFIVVKRAIEDLPPFPFLAVRFGLAFLTMLPFVWTKRQQINRKIIIQGFGLGTFLFLGYATQTIGLQYTSASNAGFITGLSVVLVPTFVAVSTRHLPRPLLLFGVVSSTLGLALLSLGSSLQLNSGDLIVLLCAFCFAAHIFFVGRYAPEANATILAAGQILAVALLSTLATFLTPQPPMHFTSYAWFGIILTAVPATSLAFFLQTKMQQFTTPSETALIFTAEPVFSAVFAFFLAGEVLNSRGIIGAALVLIGMLSAEFNGSNGSSGSSGSNKSNGSVENAEP